METKQAADFRRIYIVFVALAILTIAEFYVSTQWGSAVFLILIALAKAALIVHFFMHVYRLWREEEH
ncbi:MAG TPA: cytochrome C oxidase subunit IV family protein [Candidatus Sulfomarinibacteraceae bacterium]|nr:cytochrome C oxidase subunit IV family protein [Candidatus Sulfomarinibacteraceae bacterium]